MTRFLPPNLMALFEARPPMPFMEPVEPLIVEKNEKRVPITGIAQYVKLFEEPKETPPKPVVETREQRRERKRKEKEELLAYKLEQGIAQWQPAENPNATEDPYRTLFVSRINYETSESKLRREFEEYGRIKNLTLVTDSNGKPRGYAFIEYSDKSEMHAAYKKADGVKIDGRRLVVDYERGRTKKDWLPRRLGGGKGDTRKTREPKHVIEAREAENGFSRDRRDRSGSRDGRRDTYRRDDRGGGGNYRGGSGGYGGGYGGDRERRRSRERDDRRGRDSYNNGYNRNGGGGGGRRY